MINTICSSGSKMLTPRKECSSVYLMCVHCAVCNLCSLCAPCNSCCDAVLCIWCVHCAVLSCLCSLRAAACSVQYVQFVQDAVCAVCSLCSLCSVCATFAQLSCFLPQGVLFSNRGKWTQVQMLFHSFVCSMRSHFHIFSSRTIIKHLWALWWIRCKQLGCRGDSWMQGKTAPAQGRSGERVYPQLFGFLVLTAFVHFNWMKPTVSQHILQWKV